MVEERDPAGRVLRTGGEAKSSSLRKISHRLSTLSDTRRQRSASGCWRRPAPRSTRSAPCATLRRTRPWCMTTRRTVWKFVCPSAGCCSYEPALSPTRGCTLSVAGGALRFARWMRTRTRFWRASCSRAFPRRCAVAGASSAPSADRREPRLAALPADAAAASTCNAPAWLAASFRRAPLSPTALSMLSSTASRGEASALPGQWGGTSRAAGTAQTEEEGSLKPRDLTAAAESAALDAIPAMRRKQLMMLRWLPTSSALFSAEQAMSAPSTLPSGRPPPPAALVWALTSRPSKPGPQAGREAPAPGPWSCLREAKPRSARAV
mmetsp:Transcript_35359/g.100102  ORF Transcript_35359/g.100102 Transcript_35359/m.100102 type:complete len:322 (-) Transcript_35359:1026-1991(-)